MNYTTDIEVLDFNIFKDTLIENHPYVLRAVYENWRHESANNITYRPFSISWTNAYSGHPIRSLCTSFSHDIAHALYFYMKKKKDRVLLPNFGLTEAPKDAVWNEKWISLEVSVLALQNAILQNAGILPDDEHYRNVALNHVLPISNLEYEKLRFGKNGYSLEDLVEQRFKFWKSNIDLIKLTWDCFVRYCNRYKSRHLTLSEQ